MNHLVDRIHTMVNKRKWRQTSYVEMKGMFNYKANYEDVQ